MINGTTAVAAAEKADRNENKINADTCDGIVDSLLRIVGSS
jgi:hypothetical protein